MQDVDLFVHMAEIAGVFVGFGALIAIRSGDTSDIYDVTGIGMVVWFGILVLAGALVPLALSRFELPTHALWALSSAMMLTIFWAGDEVLVRAWPERRAFVAANPIRTRWRIELVGFFFWMPMSVALVLVLLGLLPAREEALYLGALVLLLLGDAMVLLEAVVTGFRPRRPAP